MIYFDWAATALPDRGILDAMSQTAAEFYGNPSSLHPAGKAARAAFEEARVRCAAALGAGSENLVLTSGGSEANAIAIYRFMLQRSPGTIMISALEHPSVSEAARALGTFGWTIKEIQPDSGGLITPEKLTSALNRNPKTRLVAIMGVNNETGVIQPIKALVEAVRRFSAASGEKRPIHFHSDLVQSLGKISIDLEEFDVDSASFSAHKICGPRGVGLLYHKNPQFDVLIRGGGQEHGVRPGTENPAGAAAMAQAAERYGRPDPRVAELGHALLDGLNAVDGVQIIPPARNKSPEHYAPNIIAAAFPPIPGEVTARLLAENGFAVSTGSACSSKRKGVHSKAADALNTPPEAAQSMIRISIGPETNQQNIDELLDALRQITTQYKAHGPKSAQTVTKPEL